MNGEPVSNVLTNIGSSSVGNTVFTGTVSADNLACQTITAGAISSGAITATGAAITGGSVTVTGSLAAGNDVSGATLTGTLATPTQNNITKIGTQTSFASSGTITQSGGSTTLLATTVSSLTTAGNISQTTGGNFTTAGNITQTGTTATLKATSVDSLTTSGNITQTAPGATTLQSTNVASLFTSGNIAQTGTTTTTLKATTVSSLANTGTLTQTGNASFAGTITQTGTGEIYAEGDISSDTSLSAPYITCANLNATQSVTAASFTVNGNLVQNDAASTTTLKTTTVSSLANTGTLTQTGNATFQGTIGPLASHIQTGSITTGVATFTTPTAFASGYTGYLIQWFNLGCTGNFTPFLRFAKTATTTYTSGYRVTSQLLGSTTATSTDRVTLNPRTTGLENNEQMTGEIYLRKISGTSLWFVTGFAQSNNALCCSISGHFTDPGTGIDKIVFGVTGGTLNVATASFRIEPVP